MTFHIDGPDSDRDFQVDSLSIIENLQQTDGEVLNDPGFEQPRNASLWFCSDFCQGTRVSDAFSGNWAYLASSR